MSVVTTEVAPPESLELTQPGTVGAVLEAFLSGERELTGLELYYELERASPLLEFHTMLRPGPRNRTRDGLQQSYGDHNRLLMLGLDRLLGGDLDWFPARVAPDRDVSMADLERCVGVSGSLDLPRPVLVALWLGAALHDCGMVHGRGAYVDVEDGVVMSRAVLDQLCPSEFRSLAEFALHHHDYIKDVFLGEMPVALTADALAALSEHERGLALPALALIQVAGAASLGEGRLTGFRLAIFDGCMAGTALADRSPATRLGRLLAERPEEGNRVDFGADADGLDALERVEQRDVLGFLDTVGIHGWHRRLAGSDRETRLEVLGALVDRNRQWCAQQIVWGESDDRRPQNAVHTSSNAVDVALSGCRVAVID